MTTKTVGYADNKNKWKNKREYILSCLGFMIGISNVCRFPYVCYNNGGGAFLVTCIFVFIFCGLPMFFMETSLGQFSSSGCIGIFKICPLFKGTGFAVIIVNVICTVYYTFFIAYSLVYLYYCFQKDLSWFHCNNSWNTPKCLEINNLMHADNINFTRNVTFKTPADEFFNHHILQISSGIEEMGEIVTPLLIANIISWILMFLCVMNGIRSIGKVVYVTATLPFVLLFIFFIRTITLPGAWQGIQYYIYPKWEYLCKIETWVAGANQVFFSLRPGWGVMVNMASYNKFKNNNKRDSIVIPILNDFTSIFSGFVVFSVLGYMSHQTGLPVSDVASGGLSLAYITYPQAISLLPLPHLWAVLFFLMLIFLSLDSSFNQYEVVVFGILEEFPILRKYKKAVYIAVGFVMFLCSLICTTNGGMYVTQLLDWYCSSVPVIMICLVEVFMVGWIYGADKFARDIEFMIDSKVHWWWCISWKYITPIVLLFIFITSFIFDSSVTYNGILYPTWAITLGWMSCVASIIWIPIYAVYKLISTKGSLLKRVKLNLMALESWGPDLPDQRKLWILFKKQNINLKELQNIQNIKTNFNLAMVTPNLTEPIYYHF